jgi:hypothetical protein
MRIGRGDRVVVRPGNWVRASGTPFAAGGSGRKPMGCSRLIRGYIYKASRPIHEANVLMKAA